MLRVAHACVLATGVRANPSSSRRLYGKGKRARRAPALRLPVYPLWDLVPVDDVCIRTCSLHVHVRYVVSLLYTNGQVRDLGDRERGREMHVQCTHTHVCKRICRCAFILSWGDATCSCMSLSVYILYMFSSERRELPTEPGTLIS